MGLFESMNNPWAPGGEMASRSPWAQAGKQHGWENGASELDPPTKERQADEENLQLAIAAAAAVAPEMIAEEQRNGGGGDTNQVEYLQDNSGQSSQLLDTTLSNGPEPESSTSYQSAQQTITPSLPSTQSILGPLLQPHAVPMLQQAVRSGQARLNAELHRFYGTQRQYSATAMGMREFHFALPMLVGLAEQIGRDAGLKMELRRGTKLSKRSRANVKKHIAATNLLRPSRKGEADVLETPTIETPQQEKTNPCAPTIWTELIKLTIPYQVLNELQSRNEAYWKEKEENQLLPMWMTPIDNWSATKFNTWRIQRLEDGRGRLMNRDYYEVKVTKLPQIDGHPVTVGQLFQYWKYHFNDFLDHDIADFQAYSVEDGVKFFSENPLGAVMYFDMNLIGINMDDGSVIVTNATRSSWTFSTVRTPNDHAHPVSGNREFGYKINNDGSYSFYVMGVDRLSTPLETMANNTIPFWEVIFGSADDLWKGWQASFSQRIREYGGITETPFPISERVRWDTQNRCR